MTHEELLERAERLKAIADEISNIFVNGDGPATKDEALHFLSLIISMRSEVNQLEKELRNEKL